MKGMRCDVNSPENVSTTGGGAEKRNSAPQLRASSAGKFSGSSRHASSRLRCRAWLRKLFGRTRLEAVIVLFRDPKIFCCLGQRRIDSQRLLVLDNVRRSFALPLQQSAEIAVNI